MEGEEVIDLDTLKPLVEIMAAERTKDRPDLFEDAVQEGLIAAWQASETHPGKEARYYRAAARNGVVSVLRGRPATGAEGRRGWQDAHDSSGPLVVEGSDGFEYLVAEPADATAARDFDAAEIRSAIAEAVSDLDPLDVEIVVGRFWEDLGFADLAKRTGRPAGTLSRRWTEIIRPRLAADLKDLFE